jgi:hypothetical protein
MPAASTTSDPPGPLKRYGQTSAPAPSLKQALRGYCWDVRSVVKETDAELKALPVGIEGLGHQKTVPIGDRLGMDHCGGAAGWTIQPVTESVVSYGAENPRLPVAPEKEPVAVVTERPI